MAKKMGSIILKLGWTDRQTESWTDGLTDRLTLIIIYFHIWSRVVIFAPSLSFLTIHPFCLFYIGKFLISPSKKSSYL